MGTPRVSHSARPGRRLHSLLALALLCVSLQQTAAAFEGLQELDASQTAPTRKWQVDLTTEQPRLFVLLQDCERAQQLSVSLRGQDAHTFTVSKLGEMAELENAPASAQCASASDCELDIEAAASEGACTIRVFRNLP